MRRFVITAALLLSALAAATATALRRRTALGSPRGCSPATPRSIPPTAMATFEGRMRTVRGATKLQMRFTLQTPQQGPGQLARAARPPASGSWLSSDPGVGRYVYTKRVVALFAPASYRTLRCASAGSAAAASGSPRTARPRRPATRPTCAPTCARSGSTARGGADAEHARYVVPVVNRGKTAAGPFDVVVTVDGTTLTPAQTPGLEPGERALVEVEGPPCTVGSMLTVDVDPTGAVDERAEADNRLTVTCPGAPA